jgi:hypothetical protein
MPTRPCLALFAALCLLSPQVSNAQERSTVGPVPPPGTDRGWRAPSRSKIMLDPFPAYLWHHGCGPTSLGMVVGYWDMHGYVDLVPGEAGSQNSAVNAMIANDSDHPDCGLPDGDHYQDYSCPRDDNGPIQADRSETGGAHASNCLGDFMRTSWSAAGNRYGWTWGSDVTPAFLQYVAYATPYTATAQSRLFAQMSWAAYRAEIDAGRPVALLVDSDGDGYTDHFIAAMGYDPDLMEYGCRDTWDTNVHWYLWQGMGAGRPWGIYAAYTFVFTSPDPAACAEPEVAAVPEIRLSRIVPNPAYDRFAFRVDLTRASTVRVSLTDVLGRVVRVAPARFLPAGSHALDFDLGQEPLPSGVYYLSGRSESRSGTSSVLILR